MSHPEAQRCPSKLKGRGSLNSHMDLRSSVSVRPAASGREPPLRTRTAASGLWVSVGNTSSTPGPRRLPAAAQQGGGRALTVPQTRPERDSRNP